MTDLIAKLEAATEGSRELDAEIWWKTMPPDLRASFDPTGYMARTFEQTGKYFGHFFDSRNMPMDKADFAPPFTTSLDAALTLVPEGWIVDQMGDTAVGKVGAMKTVGASVELSDGDKNVQGQGGTRALAACIAALPITAETVGRMLEARWWLLNNPRPGAPEPKADQWNEWLEAIAQRANVEVKHED